MKSGQFEIKLKMDDQRIVDRKFDKFKDVSKLMEGLKRKFK